MNFLNMPRADAKSEPVPVARAAMCAQTTCGVCDRTMARLLSPAEYAGVLIEGRRLRPQLREDKEIMVVRRVSYDTSRLMADVGAGPGCATLRTRSGPHVHPGDAVRTAHRCNSRRVAGAASCACRPRRSCAGAHRDRA